MLLTVFLFIFAQTYEKHTISIGSLVVTGIHKSGKFERQTCPIRFPMPLGVGNIGYCRGLTRACWIDDAPTLFLPVSDAFWAAGDFSYLFLD